MKTFKRIISIMMVAAVIATICVAGTIATGASGTGIGLAEWCMNAYYNDWSYVWGGSSPGAVDCSGLIWSYCGGNRTSMLSDAQSNGRDWGYVSSGIPNIHGLGLSRPGHVGVYVGNGMEVDARGTGYGVCYQAVGGWNNWDCWFKLTAVSYPENGWEKFNGDYYYYENGEYLANTSRTIDGVTYYFDASGASSQTPSDTGAKADTATTTSATSSSSDTNSGVLKKGSTGSLVEKLQERLQELGYYNGVIDGDFGDGTEEAFKEFQKAAGLYVDGIAGSDVDYLYADDAPAYTTTAAVEETQAEEKEDLASTGANADTAEAEEAEDVAEEPAAMSIGLGDYSDEILKIQEKLIALNYLSGEADGNFGALTEEAVKSFQTANGLEATGVIEQTTYDKLFSDTAVAAEKKAEEPKVTEEAAKAEGAAVTTTAAAKKTASAPNTEVEVKTTELSAKSVAAVTDSPLFKRGANATNFEFIIWLAIMIVVMLITFAIVYAVEKRKQKVAYYGRRFQ